MKNIYLRIFIILALAASAIYAGGGVRNGTGAASQLLIPVGARGIAMSGSSISGTSGLESVYWNPANLSYDQGTNVLFSHMSYIADIGVTYVGVSTNIDGFGALAFSLKSLAIDEINVTTVENPDGNGQTFQPTFLTLGVTFSRLLSDRIAVGVTMNYITEKLGLVSANAVGFDIGITYRNLANVDGLALAMALKNFGPQMRYDGSGLYINATPSTLERGEAAYKREAMAFELPSLLEIGMSYNLNFNASNYLQLSGTYQNANYYGDEVRLGMEYGLNDMFFVRGGYMFLPELDNDDANIYGLTAGLGIKYDLGGTQLKFDYAFRQTQFFDDNHVFTIQLGL